MNKSMNVSYSNNKQLSVCLTWFILFGGIFRRKAEDNL